MSEREKKLCVCVCACVCVCQRRQDNKINVKSIITGLAIFRQINLRWPPFLHIGSISVFGSWTRHAHAAQTIAAAPRRFPRISDADAGKKIYYLLLARARALLFTSDKSACRRDRHYTEPRPHLGCALYIRERDSAFPFLNYRSGMKNDSVLCV